MDANVRARVYAKILEEELLPAMGCTEPIAVAYAAAVARDVLGAPPERVLAQVSGNIIKNVKSVIVPNTGRLKGIEASVAAGIAAGKAEKLLEVIADVNEAERREIKSFLDRVPIEVRVADTPHIFYICITVYGGGHTAKVCIQEYHTHIVSVARDGVALQHSPAEPTRAAEPEGDKTLLKVRDIVAFADTADLTPLLPLLDRQIAYNRAIAEEGLRGDYGANIGKVLLRVYGDDIKIRAKAKAAAGSDARMNGCELPVVIVSGSGNQGIAASVPVMEYAAALGASPEKLYRALLVSNLITVHLKTGIGRLSAYCGAVSAGSGSGAGIAYLYGGGLKEIAHTVVNSLAIVSGIICDGAKASCAAKIAMSVEAGILGYHMYREGQQFRSGDGIVTKGIEATIANVGRLASDGMRETDKEIIRIMMDKEPCPY